MEVVRERKKGRKKEEKKEGKKGENKLLETYQRSFQAETAFLLRSSSLSRSLTVGLLELAEVSSRDVGGVRGGGVAHGTSLEWRKGGREEGRKGGREEGRGREDGGLMIEFGGLDKEGSRKTRRAHGDGEKEGGDEAKLGGRKDHGAGCCLRL